MLIIDVLMLAVGLGLLIKGADYFVNVAVRLAKSMGVSEFVIGLTIVAFGTSFPEFATSIVASFHGHTDLIIGNQVGSNLANMCLIIGLAAVISQIRTRGEMVSRDGYVMLLGGFLFILITIDGKIVLWESIILLSLYVAYIVFLIVGKAKYRGQYHFREFVTFYFTLQYIQHLTTLARDSVRDALPRSRARQQASDQARSKLRLEVIKDLFLLLFFGFLVVLGANLLVTGAVHLALAFDISTTVIGLTVVAIGTSLPELSVVLSAAKKGYGEIAIGNVIGANIANIFLNIGVAGLISRIFVPDIARFYTIPVMVFAMLVFLVFMRSNWTISRFEGACLLLMYGLFMAVLLLGF